MEGEVRNRSRPGAYARGEDTRRRILETALEMFATHGYEGASTRLLAERAGVNLPAIQYYFGSKEGLYRAIISDIISHTEAHMAPLSLKMRAMLADPGISRAELLELLCQMLEAFVALVTGGPQVESKRLFFARAEVEDTPGLEELHENGRQQIFEPCLDLIGRLLGRSPEDEATVLSTMAVIGQVTIFCHNKVQHLLKTPEFTPERVRAIQALVRSHTMAVFAAQQSISPNQSE
jgi:TetR/AcrR family transcriptional regulator, regulator of cefoperazone and chloramphenicol sensitivity